MFKEENKLATLSPIASAISNHTVEAEPLELTEAQYEIVMSAYDNAYNDDRSETCPHYAMSANESNNKLRLDLRAVPLTLHMTFPEFIHVIAKPIFEGRFEGLEILTAHTNYDDRPLLLGEEIDELITVVTCYQLNDDGERIDDAHDIEIKVHWDSVMTETSNFRLVEKLFYDMSKVDFSAEHLNESLALIGNAKY
ncbi:MAG: hypothetical protein QNK36_21040 [Colwellia sp.]|nr:hypothetical protein [Colwellia sp.]